MSSQIEEQMQSLEHSTLRAPYETLNKNFRHAQKVLEKETSGISTFADELRDKANAPDLNFAEFKTMFSSFAERLNQIKRKAEDSFDNEIEAAEACKKRILCLLSLGQLSKDDPAKWEEVRFDRMLIEHLLHHDHYDSALALATSKGLIDSTNFDIYRNLREIYHSLLKKETKKCLEWCNDNKSKLKKINSNLEFVLYQQEFIELVKKDMRIAAVKYSKIHLQKFRTSINDLQHTMGLLAYSIDTDIPEYKILLDENRWQHICEQFKSDSAKMYNLGNISRFSAVLQAGISALKTSTCFMSQELRNSNCPICSTALNTFAECLPSSYCAQSKIFCNISKEPIDENNFPYMLPNGFVYGIISLQKMANENNGNIICPRTNQVYTINDLKRVYVM